MNDAYGNWVPGVQSQGIVYPPVTASTGGGTAQMVTYTSGVPADPTDVTLPAVAYDPQQLLPTKYWDNVGHSWK